MGVPNGAPIGLVRAGWRALQQVDEGSAQLGAPDETGDTGGVATGVEMDSWLGNRTTLEIILTTVLATGFLLRFFQRCCTARKPEPQQAEQTGFGGARSSVDSALQPEPEPEPELEPELKLKPEPEPEPEYSLEHTTSGPHPPYLTVDDSHPFRSCLDRAYVQKEIRWAKQYKKKIIIVFEKEAHRPGYFDYTMAKAKYTGTEWEFILSIDAIQYQREQYLAEAMLANVLDKAETADVAAAERPINPPGAWDFFLSHHQALGGDQMKTLSLLFERVGKTVWYDNGKLDKSEKAMEEGVKHCKNFVLLLTAEMITQSAAAQHSAAAQQSPAQSPTPTSRAVESPEGWMQWEAARVAIAKHLEMMGLLERAAMERTVLLMENGITEAEEVDQLTEAELKTVGGFKFGDLKKVATYRSQPPEAEAERKPDTEPDVDQTSHLQLSGRVRGGRQIEVAVEGETLYVDVDEADTMDDIRWKVKAKRMEFELSSREAAAPTEERSAAEAEGAAGAGAGAGADADAERVVLIEEAESGPGGQHGPVTTTASMFPAGVIVPLRLSEGQPPVQNLSAELPRTVPTRNTRPAAPARPTASPQVANARRRRRSQQQLQPFDMDQLLSKERSSWDVAVRACGHSDREALALGVSRFVLWHAAQPVVYFISFGVYAASGDLIASQLLAGSFVLVREGLYLLSVMLCTWVRPAFLLVDIGATARGSNGIEGHFWAVTYVLAPEKFVMRVLFSADDDISELLAFDWMSGLPDWLTYLATLLVCIPAYLLAAFMILAAIGGDLIAVPYALGAGLGADDVPLALLLGYSIAAVGALWVILPALATIPWYVGVTATKFADKDEWRGWRDRSPGGVITVVLFGGFFFLVFLLVLVVFAVGYPAALFWWGFRDARIHALREECAESLATMGGWPCANTTTVHVPPVMGEAPAALGCSVEAQAVVDLTYSSCADFYEHYFAPQHLNPFHRGFMQNWNSYGCPDEDHDTDYGRQCTPQGLLNFSLPGFVYAPELDFEQNFANMTALVAAIAGSCGCADDARTLQPTANFGVAQTTEHWGCGCGGCGCLEQQERCICGGPCSAQLNETQCTATDGSTFFFADKPCAWDDGAEAGEPKCAAVEWHKAVEIIVWVLALTLCVGLPCVLVFDNIFRL
eukprot:COSAG02_NODE_5218_length_4530_cov_14.302866_1_plen_1150_part_00